MATYQNAVENQFCRGAFYARTLIGYMFCSNLDIMFVYPHLGSWATFGGLLMGRVQEIFPGTCQFVSSWK